jgi:hypothetical protein
MEDVIEPPSSQWECPPATQSGRVRWQPTQPSNRALDALMQQAQDTRQIRTNTYILSVSPYSNYFVARASKLPPTWDTSTLRANSSFGSTSSISLSKSRRPSTSKHSETPGPALSPESDDVLANLRNNLRSAFDKVTENAYAKKRFFELQKEKDQSARRRKDKGKGKERAGSERPAPYTSFKRAKIARAASLPTPGTSSATSCAMLHSATPTGADVANYMDLDEEIPPSLSAQQMPPPPLPQRSSLLKSSSASGNQMDSSSLNDMHVDMGLSVTSTMNHIPSLPAKLPTFDPVRRKARQQMHSDVPHALQATHLSHRPVIIDVAPSGLQPIIHPVPSPDSDIIPKPSPPSIPMPTHASPPAPGPSQGPLSQSARKPVLGMTARSVKTLQPSTALPTRQKGFKTPFARVASAPAEALLVDVGETAASTWTHDGGRRGVAISRSGNETSNTGAMPPDSAESSAGWKQLDQMHSARQHVDVVHARSRSEERLQGCDAVDRQCISGSSEQRGGRDTSRSPVLDEDSSYGEISIDMDTLDEVMSKYD